MSARELRDEPQRPVTRAEREPRTECVGDLEALEDGLHARPRIRTPSRRHASIADQQESGRRGFIDRGRSRLVEALRSSNPYD